MSDLPSIVEPRKLAWEQGDGERIAHILPGPPNTTLDRSAIGDHEAQDVLNVTMVNGVWELDQRYRQFAPSPIPITDIVLHEASPFGVLANCTSGGLSHQFASHIPMPPGYCWSLGDTTQVIDNPAPGEYLVIQGFAWTVTHEIVSIKIDHLQVSCTAKGGAAVPASIRVALTKTNNSAPATSYHNIPLIADGVTRDLAVIDFSSEMTLTAAEAASGNVGIIIDWSAAFTNCEIVVYASTASVQVGESATAGSVTGSGLVYAEYSNCDEYVAVISGGIHSINGSFVDVASANNWSADLSPSGTVLNALFWEGCQFGSEEFITEPSTGVFRRTICGKDIYGVDSVFVPLYQDYQHPGSNGDAAAQIIVPPYLPHTFNHLVDTVSLVANTTSPAMGLVLTLDATSNKPTYAITNGSWNGTGYIEIEIGLSVAIDFTKTGQLMDYLMLHWLTSKTLNGSGQQSDLDNGNLGFQGLLAGYQVRFADSSGFVVGHETAYYQAESRSALLNSQQRDFFAFFDLNTAIGTFPGIMAACKAIRIRFSPRGVGTSPSPQYYRIDEFIPLGQYYHFNYPTKQLTPATDPATDGPVVWAYNYTEGATIGKARLVQATASQALGTRYDPHVPFGGSFITVTIPEAPAPFTSAARQNIYRQTANGYQRVARSAGSADPFVFADQLTDFDIEGDTATYPITVLSFDPLTAADSGQATNMICCCSWKGSLIFFGKDGNAYGSQTNNPQVFFWPDINPDLTGVAESEVPRTLQIANNQGLPVLAGVAQSVLYMFTRKEGYTMRSLSTFAQADFPSRIGGCRGVCGTRSACAFDAGALFGSDDGLWYVAVNPYAPTVAGDTAPDQMIEVTASNRRLWARLIGTATQRAELVVQTTGQDIWCFCEDRYIHVDMRRGHVLTYGEWATGKSVSDAHGDPKRGMVVLFSDGTIGVCGPYLSDGGLDAAGLTGNPPTWYWKGKRFVEPMSLLAIRAVWENQLPLTQPASGRVTAFSQRGSASGDSIDFTDAGGVGMTPFDTSIVEQNKKPGGDLFEIQVSGSAWDKVTHLELRATPDQPKRLTR